MKKNGTIVVDLGDMSFYMLLFLITNKSFTPATDNYHLHNHCCTVANTVQPESALMVGSPEYLYTASDHRRYGKERVYRMPHSIYFYLNVLSCGGWQL
jgi:hypothetical protein